MSNVDPMIPELISVHHSNRHQRTFGFLTHAVRVTSPSTRTAGHPSAGEAKSKLANDFGISRETAYAYLRAAP
ncbi:hypothetical protein [Nocardia salmonicida]